jgi:hypothetical protein
MINLASHLLKHSLFNLEGHPAFRTHALGPLRRRWVSRQTPGFSIKLSRKCHIFLEQDREKPVASDKPGEMIEASFPKMALSGPVLFNRTIHPQSEMTDTVPGEGFELDILFPGKDECSITLVLPDLFFKRFMHFKPGENIEHQVEDFYLKPGVLRPSLPMLMEDLTRPSLHGLLRDLLSSSSISLYQILLLIHAFPARSLDIRGMLSRNRQQDLTSLRKKYRKEGISNRDIQQGIYSVEEALSFMLKRGSPFREVKEWQDISRMIILLRSIRLLLRKPFDQWLDECIEKNLINQSLARTGEKDIASMIRSSESVRKRFLPYISDNLMDEISLHLDMPEELPSGMEARARFLLNYRELDNRRLQRKKRNFEVILRSIENREGFHHLLDEAGWFLLSTALKGCSKSIVTDISSSLPAGAGSLIEDAVSGRVNPDILQDEMQVEKARNKVTGFILELNRQGVVILT